MNGQGGKYVNHHHRHSWHGGSNGDGSIVDNDNSSMIIEDNAHPSGTTDLLELPLTLNSTSARSDHQNKKENEKKKTLKFAHGRSGSLGRLLGSGKYGVLGSESSSLGLGIGTSSSHSSASLASSPRSLSTSSLKIKHSRCVGTAGINGMGFATRLGFAFEQNGRQSKKNASLKRRLMGIIVFVFSALAFTLLVFLIVLLLQTKGPRIVSIVPSLPSEQDNVVDYGFQNQVLGFATGILNSSPSEAVANQLHNVKHYNQESLQHISVGSRAVKHRSKILDVTDMYFGNWEGSLSNATLPPWPPQRHRVAIFTGTALLLTFKKLFSLSSFMLIKKPCNDSNLKSFRLFCKNQVHTVTSLMVLA